MGPSHRWRPRPDWAVGPLLPGPARTPAALLTVIEAMAARHLSKVYDERLDATRRLGPWLLPRLLLSRSWLRSSRLRARLRSRRPQLVVAFADPASDLAAAVSWNGRVAMQPRTLSASIGCWVSSTRTWGWHQRSGCRSLNRPSAPARRIHKRILFRNVNDSDGAEHAFGVPNGHGQGPWGPPDRQLGVAGWTMKGPGPAPTACTQLSQTADPPRAWWSAAMLGYNRVRGGQGQRPTPRRAMI